MDQEFQDEIAFHLEMATNDMIREGIEPAEARRRARIAFGGVDRYREKAREERGVRPVQDAIQDARYAVRQIRRNPGFAVLAIATMALGIGATTTIFSVVNGILLSPLSFQEPNRLVQVWPERSFTKSLYSQFGAEASFLDGLSAINVRSFTLPGEGGLEPEVLRGAMVSHNYFQVLGAAPVLGRGFTAEDEVPGQGQVVILSHGLWERRFGSDPEILGKAISVGEEEGASRIVVGVMAEDYRPVYEGRQVWVPFQIDPSNFPDFEGTASLRLLGRLAEGTSLEVADARFHELADRLTADLDFITDEERAVAGLHPLKEALLGDVRLRLLILMGSVGLVLLLACINVANLLLAKGHSREKELGIRLAVGAGRGRVIRQLITESLVLGLVGGGIGVLLAFWFLPALIGILPASVPRTDLIRLDERVLIFSLLVSVLSALLFGLLPAFRASKRDVQASLKDGGRGSDRATSGHKLRSGLVVVELALAVVVIVGASLLFRSFWLLQHEDLGFEASRVVTLRLNLPVDRYPDEAGRHQFYQQVSQQARGLPQVTEVGWTNFLPFAGGGMGIRYRSDDSPVSTDYVAGYAGVRAVSSEFFSALRVPLVDGGYPEGLAVGETGEQVLVNRAMALSLWPDGETAVGKTVWLPFGSETPARITGVVEDFAQVSVERAVQPDIYIPWELWSPERMYLLLRTDGDPEALLPGVRSAIWAVDSEIPVTFVRTMEEVVNRTLADSRLTALLLMVFGTLALTLGAVGVYGVASYAVTQSTFEIGVRMALGAGGAGVMASVVRRFLIVSAVGIILGVGVALGVSRVLSSLLYEVSATDPATFLGVGGFLTLVALAAIVFPAYRASRVDPARVLKGE